ncbi:hypothetical protein H696_00344 [Fonticula alba]|uniref:HIT-type domain-containing protein n=1 Tax=Fonticula alba TaxID=691883 RepID=A0A058ZFN6_FONAL|nr:hypothetical protein H696_00344 [Fonticula alba]KCV72766.1 hypothetical protein H696_00344 [Fonticula alba]|eukprot:XP_009492467.1 hypothetical protein H696_00344 [Fonticula alba]
MTAPGHPLPEEGARESGPPSAMGPTPAMCSVCTSNPWKYRCPSCRAVTCSLICVRQHREQAACSGSRPTPDNQMVKLAHFDTGQLQRDLTFLHEIQRVTQASQIEHNTLARRGGPGGSANQPASSGPGSRGRRSAPGGSGNPQHQVPPRLRLLAKHAARRGVTLKFLPQGMSRSLANTSYFHISEKKIYWRLEIVLFSDQTSPDARVTLVSVPEDAPMAAVLHAAARAWHVAPGRQAHFGPLLAAYQEAFPDRVLEPAAVAPAPGKAPDARSLDPKAPQAGTLPEFVRPLSSLTESDLPPGETEADQPADGFDVTAFPSAAAIHEGAVDAGEPVVFLIRRTPGKANQREFFLLPSLRLTLGTLLRHAGEVIEFPAILACSPADVAHLIQADSDSPTAHLPGGRSAHGDSQADEPVSFFESETDPMPPTSGTLPVAHPPSRPSIDTRVCLVPLEDLSADPEWIHQKARRARRPPAVIATTVPPPSMVPPPGTGSLQALFAGYMGGSDSDSDSEPESVPSVPPQAKRQRTEDP